MNKKLSHSEILSERKTISQMAEIKRFPLMVMLNNVRSMHNTGSIFRTSDAACIQKVIITGYTACPQRPEIEKTALGATDTVPWHYFKDPLEAIQFYKSQNVDFVALEQTNNSTSVYDYKTNKEKKICLVLGNEVYGIDQNVLDQCDAFIDIPMYGMKHSLNVSVAYGIAAFELIKKFQ